MKNLPLVHRQRGAAALVTTALLLFGMSLVVFYLNRSLIFEQKTSANQLRSTSAQETAEAGLEWVTGMLNSPFDIDANCVLQATALKSFRRTYLQTYWGGATAPPAAFYKDNYSVVPVRLTYPGCKINGSTLSCSCPTINTGASAFAINATTGLSNETQAAANLGTAVQPGFTVTFAPVPATYPPAANVNQNDTRAVQVTVTGCTAWSGVCLPGTGSGSGTQPDGTVGGPDAVASVSAIIKLVPIVNAAPPAPLVCGTSCDLTKGSMQVVNTDPSTNGITINAGTTIGTKNAGTTITMPGLPYQNSMVGADSSLATLSSSDPTCTNSAMFKTFFGSTIQQYAASPVVDTIVCTSTCDAQLTSAINAGWRSFYFPSGFQLSGSNTYGAPGDPVNLVTPGTVKINGSNTIYGMVFSNDATTNDIGTGSSTIVGALVACSSYNSNGNGTLSYDPSVIEGLQAASADAIRVPGSWTDACKLSTATTPPTRSCN